MARSRNIKPGFFTNDDLGELEPLARLLFAGMWTIADRSGRLEDRPKKIKAEVLPYDNCDAEAFLAQLAERGFILRYEAVGKRFIQILAWGKHQNPHCKEAASTIPAPDGHVDEQEEEQVKHGASTVQAQVEHSPLPERAGLIPDSLNLIPDSSPLIPEVKKAARAPRKPAADAAVSLSIADLAAEGVDPQHAQDWFKTRQDKGAKTLTPTAWSAVKAEAAKAGMTPADAVKTAAENAWQGFKADWLHQATRASPSKPPTAAQMAMAQACPTLVAPHLQGYAKQHEPTYAEVINADARLLD